MAHHAIGRFDVHVLANLPNRRTVAALYDAIANKIVNGLLLIGERAIHKWPFKRWAQDKRWRVRKYTCDSLFSITWKYLVGQFSAPRLHGDRDNCVANEAGALQV